MDELRPQLESVELAEADGSSLSSSCCEKNGGPAMANDFEGNKKLF